MPSIRRNRSALPLLRTRDSLGMGWGADLLIQQSHGLSRDSWSCPGYPGIANNVRQVPKESRGGWISPKQKTPVVSLLGASETALKEHQRWACSQTRRGFSKAGPSSLREPPNKHSCVSSQVCHTRPGSMMLCQELLHSEPAGQLGRAARVPPPAEISLFLIRFS